MADSLTAPVEIPSTIAKVESGIASAAKFVGNGLRAAGESVVNDGATVFAKDVTVGARVEAGVNLAADALSVVTLSPEDAALERGAVFAIKEGVEHAPQLTEAAVALAKTGAREIGEHAPQVEKAVATTFERSKGAIEAAGHEILDSSAAKGFIETKNAVYHIAEGVHHDGMRLTEHLTKAIAAGKNFAVHAPELAEEAVNRIKASSIEKAFEHNGLKAVVADSEHAIASSVHDVESGHAVTRAVVAAEKRIEPLTKAYDTAKKAIGVGTAAVAAYAERGKIEHIAHEAVAHVEHAAESAAHHIGEVAHATEHGVEQGVAAVSAGVKNVVDDVKHWSPGMSAENFEKMLGMVRGGQGAPTVAPSAPARTQQQQHGISH